MARGPRKGDEYDYRLDKRGSDSPIRVRELVQDGADFDATLDRIHNSATLVLTASGFVNCIECGCSFPTNAISLDEVRCIWCNAE
jgi:hypothetical protein